MALGLVARASVVLSDHLNSWFRVWKGTDAESIYLRLPTAGSFEVRHSVSNAPVFKVTDAGITGGIPGGDILDGTVTSAGLADGTIQTADIGDGQITSVKIMDGTIQTVDIGDGQVTNAKLGPNAVTTDKIADGTIATADMTQNTINADRLADGTLTTAKMTANTINADRLADGTVTSAKILDGSLVNADINAAAAVALSKLAPGASGVLKSNGTTITAGNLVVTGDMAINTINGDRITDATILGAKISGGAPPPNGVGAADAYKVYATGSAGTTVSLQQVLTQMLAPNAVTTLYTAGPASYSTASPALGNSGIQISVPWVTGDVALIGVSGVIYTTTGGSAVAHVAVADTPTGYVFDIGFNTSPAGGTSFPYAYTMIYTSPSTSTRTVGIQTSVAGGVTLNIISSIIWAIVIRR